MLAKVDDGWDPKGYNCGGEWYVNVMEEIKEIAHNALEEAPHA